MARTLPNVTYKANSLAGNDWRPNVAGGVVVGGLQRREEMDTLKGKMSWSTVGARVCGGLL
jgi:hypothetical protein